jgi:heme A synthase
MGAGAPRHRIDYPRGRLRLSTTIKLAIAAVLAILFGGLALRAAMRLVSTATHSLFFGVVLLVLVVWIFASRKREER